MNNIQEMLKAIILAGRDEGYMEPGDNASATAEILVIFSGYDQAYNEDEDEEIHVKSKSKRVTKSKSKKNSAIKSLFDLKPIENISENYLDCTSELVEEEYI